MGHAHEHLDSGDTEHYTPERIVEAARLTLGGIDLDPASCEEANRVVNATRFYTKEDNGLVLPWSGRVWLNHPFGKEEEPCKPGCRKKSCDKRGCHLTERKPGNVDWINKLIASYLLGDIEAACCITWANVDTEWFRPLLAFPQCFPHGRVHYRQPGGETANSAPKGSVITYLGEEVDRFASAFESIGTVKVPYERSPEVSP